MYAFYYISIYYYRYNLQVGVYSPPCKGRLICPLSMLASALLSNFTLVRGILSLHLIFCWLWLFGLLEYWYLLFWLLCCNLIIVIYTSDLIGTALPWTIVVLLVLALLGVTLPGAIIIILALSMLLVTILLVTKVVLISTLVCAFKFILV